MILNLNDPQFKTSRYSCRSLYINPMIPTKQKSTVDIQNQRERKTSIPLKKIIKPQGKKLKEERTTNTTRKQVTK